MSTKTNFKYSNLDEFKQAVQSGQITDYGPYIEHIPSITPSNDEVYQRRRWLIEKDIATEEIAKTTIEDEKVYIIDRIMDLNK